MKVFVSIFLLVVLSLSADGPAGLNQESNGIICDSGGCYGQYEGPEFSNGSDVAHQFSNTMSAAVGDQLKLLYASKQYVRVDFDKIVMSTKGMGSGQVVYYLKIPFKAVAKACDAYTAFDHVGGWNHKPALAARKRQLSKALMAGDSLAISALKRTPEGLQEHWIQWRHKRVQSACALK